jgi:hexosaminidase
MKSYPSLPFFPTRKACFDGGKLTVDCDAIASAVQSTGLPHEGFCITAKADGIRIEGNTPAAVDYARAIIHTVCQSDADGSFPLGVFEDYPDFPVRAYMLDISRCKVPKMAQLRRLVDALAALRYNQLQLYMEHVFAYPQHATVWAEASPMTADEVRELDAYCQARHIELVPNQNSFGHMERWLRHPEYRSLAECPDGFMHPIAGPREFGSVLYPGDESLNFLAGLYDELLPNFTGERLHVGCDEPWELGQGRSSEAVTERGKQRVYLDFLRKIESLVASRGKVMHYWADILLERPELIAEAPAGAIPVIWGYAVDHPFAEQCALLAENGMAFQVAPGDASWKCFSGRLETTLQNQRLAAREGLRQGAGGYVLTHWGDLGHHQPWPMALPALVIGGQLAWNAAAEVEQGLAATMNHLFFHETSPILAEVLLDLGRLDSRVPPIRVGSWFYEALMREVETPLAAENSARLLDQLNILDSRLETAQPKAEDGAWLRDEMRLGIAMTRWAIRRNGGRAEQAAWQQARSALMHDFETIWLRRNRPGGLRESLAYFPG